jgi:hypothetical protein
MLSFFDSTAKKISTSSCVKKLTRTRVPSNVYDMPYSSINVENRIGGRQNTEDIVKYAE